MPATRLSALARRLFRAPVSLYRWHCGWLLGHRFILLRHTGRRSGLPRETVLEVLEYRPDGPEIVVLSGFGRSADWLRNLQADAACEIVIGNRRFAAAWRCLGIDEAACALAGYEQRQRLIAPVVRAVLGRLVGWRYDGSEAARRRVVAELPVIAFRPRP